MSNRPVRRLAAAAVTTLALVALAACNNDDSGSAGGSSDGDSPSSASSTSSSAATSSSAPTDAGSSSSAGAPQVTVLDAGSDPKEQLLLDVPEGQVETSTLDMKIGSSSSAGSVKVPITMIYVTTVDAVTDDQITATFEFKDIEAHLPASAGADAQNQVDQAFKSIQGLRGTIELTPSGTVTSTHFQLPADAPPELSSTINQLTSQTSQVAVPFPSEPVGQGAKWQVETHLDVSGVDTDQTATYTLDSIDGDHYSISVELDQQLKGSSSGADISGTTSISGTYQGALTSFAATSGSLSGSGTSTASVGGQTLDTKTTIDMDISTDVQ